MLLRLGAWLRALKSDRGEGPVPYIIIVAIIATVAVGVAVAISDVADKWIEDLQNVDRP